MAPGVAVVFIGNPIYGDDALPLIIGGKIRDRLHGVGINVYILEESFLEIVDLLAGRDIVIIVDSIKTGRAPLGSLILIDLMEEDAYIPRTPHYIGLPQAISIYRELGLGPPARIYIIGIEVEDPYTLREGLSRPLMDNLDSIAREVYNKIIDLISINRC